LFSESLRRGGFVKTPVTDEILIYDLTKSPAQNRPDGDVSNYTDVGAAIFPVGFENLPSDNISVEEEEQHHTSSAFRWAPDSRAIAFVDTTNKTPQAIVLVELDDRGVPTAFEHE
jgi:hypothetical protein